MKPIEETYMYDKFYETLMNDNDFEAKPMVLLIGQYSVGKTSFIRYLLECDYQGMRVGPEPTTDKFISVMYGDVERVIPGNAAYMSTTHQIINLAKHTIGRETSKISKEIHLLHCKEILEVIIPQRLIPEGS